MELITGLGMVIALDIISGLSSWKILNLGSNGYHASAILLSNAIEQFKQSPSNLMSS
jgi:hypothetical protein